MLNKKKFLIFLIPSFLINYLTLTLIDHDNNLSNFSSLIVFLFNFINLILAYIFSYYGLLKSFIYFLISIITIIFFDTIALKLQQNKSIQVYDKELGWILNNNIKIKINGLTKQNQKYEINYSTSKVKGFREYDEKQEYKKNILVIGDSYTAGPFASNNRMYYSHIKEELEKKGHFFNWYVAGGGGYGTLQQYLLIKKYFDEINPTIIIHQFCENDFENNTKQIEKNSILYSQYYFRPYLINDKIVYDNSFKGKLYKFFYHNSYLYKRIDKILTNHRYRNNNGYFDKKAYNNNFENSKKITSGIFKLIKNLVGNKVVYASINCSAKDKQKFNSWIKILNEHKIINLSNSNLIIENISKKGEDIYYSDGAHLNENGNKIFGKSAAVELIKKLNLN